MRWDYHHPEIKEPWTAEADDDGLARAAFEGMWIDAVARGDLAEVQGRFRDGSILPSDG